MKDILQHRMEINNVAESKNSIHLAISFRKLCLATVSLPLITLLFCFITAYIYQQDDIHETHCRVCTINIYNLRKILIYLIILFQVYNVLPSISAITGISPQRYLWRVCIALHIGPRLLIASVYYSFYRKTVMTIEDVPKRLLGIKLLNLCYWLNIAEVE